MKRFFLLFMLIALTASCVPNSGATSTPEPTKLPTNTSTPTTAPTETTTPTPTKDPNAPDDFTRFENGVYYLDTNENGILFTYTFDLEQKLWLREISPDKGYPIIDWPERKEMIPMKVYVSSDVPGGYDLIKLSHTDVTDYKDQSPISGIFAQMINERFHQNERVSQDELTKFFDDFFAEKISLPLITSKGETIQFALRHDKGIKVVIVNPDLLEPLIGNGASKSYDYYLLVYSDLPGIDKEGNLVCRVAPKTPINRIDDSHLRKLLFHCAFNILIDEDQREQYITYTLLGVIADHSKSKRRDYTSELSITRSK